MYRIDTSVYIDRPDGADISSSQDRLLSPSTNSSGSWAFHGIWETASTLWRRMTSGNDTLYKSKCE